MIVILLIVFLIRTIICAVVFGIGAIFRHDIHLHLLAHSMRRGLAFYSRGPELSALFNITFLFLHHYIELFHDI